MRIVIIGGGPAGMMAAIGAKKKILNNINSTNIVLDVLLVEKNEKLGKKLFITGKGRCNLTNNCDIECFLKNIVRNPKFIYSSYEEFSKDDLMQLVEDNGCKLKTERGNRVFPVSDKSYDVIEALRKALKKYGVNVKLNTEIIDIKVFKKNDNDINNAEDNNYNNIFELKTNKKEKIIADKVIIATGGVSYKSTGSTGDGYKFAKQFNINVMPTYPSLVPLNALEVEDCKNMQGLTLKNVAISILNSSNKILYKDFGELLFTHFGVSGPMILSASSYLELNYDSDGFNICDSKLNIQNENEDKYILSIDLKPALNIEQLDNRLIRDFESNKNKELKSIISLLLPSSMIDVFLKRLTKLCNNNDIGIIKVSNVNKQTRKNIISLLKDFRFTIISKRSFNEAIVTRGGVDVKEINPKTMESKSVKGLYFAGEVLDIDALTGGFNIQLATTTGYVAGESASNDFQ